MTQGYGNITVTQIEDPRKNVVARKGAGKSGGGGGGVTTPHQPLVMPNTLQSRASVKILELLSEGPIYGMVFPDGTDAGTIWQGVYLDGTPIADRAGNFRFAVRNGDIRYGFPGQSNILGYSETESEVSVGVQCKFAIPVVRSVDLPVTAIRIKVRIPALYDQEDDGDVVNATVVYAVDYSLNGGTWTNVLTEAITGKTVSPYERAVHLYIPGADTATTLDIRMERLSPDDIPHVSNLLVFQGFTQIIYDHMSYEDSALISMTVSADEFQSVPQRSYLLKGLMMQIPTNYNGHTHGYSGDWDGTFYTQWTNNPAWVLYNLMTNTRWGLGNFLDVSGIDKWSFYDAAVFNDAWMDSFGEVRYRCNCVINTRQDAYALLQAIASSMIAQLYYSNGTVFLVQDRPLVTPVRLFAPADVQHGIFDYTSADVRSRYNAVPVMWNDPADDYKPAIELVQDHSLVSQQGYREAPQQAMFGCTSRGQAVRWGRWFIYTNQFETEVVTFKTGIENADIRPGDFIYLSDPSRVGARLAGRVLSQTGTQITLDKVALEMTGGAASTYSIFITVGSAGEGEEPTVYQLSIVSVIDADAGIIEVASVPGGGIPAGSMWLARAGAVEPTTWRVAAIRDGEDGMYEIVATEYHVEKWSYIQQGFLVPPPSFDLIPTGPIAPPTNLTFTEFIYRDAAGQPQFGIVISWSASTDPRVQRYQVELSGPSGDYRKFTQISGVAQEVLTMRHGQWTVALSAFDNIGRRAPVVTLTFQPVGLTALPQPPSALYLSPQGQLTTLTWVPTGEIDVTYYWLKWSPLTDGSATWFTATTSMARVPYNATEFVTPTRAGTFFMKAIDSLGQESELYAEAIQLVQRTERVHVIDIDEQPDWGGDRGTNWHLNTGQLWVPPPDAPEVVPAGVFPGDRAVILNKTPTRIDVYGFEDTVNLGMVTAGVSIVSMVRGFGTFFGIVMADWVTLASVDPLASGAGNTMSSWRPLAMAKPLAMGGSDQWDAHIEMRVAQDDAVFSDWFPVKSTLITGQQFEFRLIGSLYDLATTLRMIEASVTLEVPLRNVQGSDVPLNVVTGALTVTYPIPFMTTPTVQITARQSLSAGGNIVITASDETSFSVQHKNAAGSNVGGGSIDYFVQGYGGHAA